MREFTGQLEESAANARVEDGLSSGLFAVLPADVVAGIWREGPGLVIAVAAEREDAERRLRQAFPRERFRVVAAERSLAELAALADELFDALEEHLSAMGLDEIGNCVSVMVPRLDDPSVAVVRQRFAGCPVRWEEGTVEAC